MAEERGSGLTAERYLLIGLLLGILAMVALFSVGGVVWFAASGRLEQQQAAAQQQQIAQEQARARHEAMLRQQYRQQVPQAMPMPPAVINPPLSLFHYEPFDGRLAGVQCATPPRFVPGRSGQAALVRLTDMIVSQCPPQFEQSGTIMAWVRCDNQAGRSFFWYHSRLYPSAVFYPDHEYRLSVQFAGRNAQAASFTLAPTMRAGQWYHLAQTWGADGFCAYLDGVLVRQDAANDAGIMTPASHGSTNELHLGSAPNARPGQSGPGWQLNMDGVYLDDLAICRGQATADDIRAIAAGTTPPARFGAATD